MLWRGFVVSKDVGLVFVVVQQQRDVSHLLQNRLARRSEGAGNFCVNSPSVNGALGGVYGEKWGVLARGAGGIK